MWPGSTWSQILPYPSIYGNSEFSGDLSNCSIKVPVSPYSDEKVPQQSKGCENFFCSIQNTLYQIVLHVEKCKAKLKSNKVNLKNDFGVDQFSSASENIFFGVK